MRWLTGAGATGGLCHKDDFVAPELTR